MMTNEELKVKEEFILLIAYYVMVLLAMLSTILCTCRRKNDKPLLCCGSKQGRVPNSDYAQCIPTISLAIFKKKENNECDVKSNAGNCMNCINTSTIYNANLPFYNFRSSIKSCPGYKKYPTKRETVMLKLNVISEAQQEESHEAGESFEV